MNKALCLPPQISEMIWGDRHSSRQPVHCDKYVKKNLTSI